MPSPYARLLRWIERPKTTAADVRLDGLTGSALPRIDYSDAFAVERRRETPSDPRAWADAIFHSPPAWVATLMGLREALVGLVGIERGTPESFAVLAADGDIDGGWTPTEEAGWVREVLLGSDAGALCTEAAVAGILDCMKRRVGCASVLGAHAVWCTAHDPAAVRGAS